jgi:hypothetical protein
MFTKFRIFGIIVMSFILIFSFIHLAVGIVIIVKDRSYGDMFHSEIGLGSACIVISFVGILVGAIGLICILTNQRLIGKFLFIF